MALEADTGGGIALYVKCCSRLFNLEEIAQQSPTVAPSSGLPWENVENNSQPRRGCGKVSPMPQALSAVYLHLVFSTTERKPLLRDNSTRESLHAYLGNVSKQLDCPALIVGGMEDHVHLLARFSRTITQAEWVKELKRVSNHWLKEQGSDYSTFEWQGGYAVFSVSPSNLAAVTKYIGNQEQHHQKTGFQDELRALLRKHRLEWDERYLWD